MKVLLKKLASDREVKKVANFAFMLIVVVMLGIMLWTMSGMSSKLDEIMGGVSSSPTIGQID